MKLQIVIVLIVVIVGLSSALAWSKIVNAKKRAAKSTNQGGGGDAI